MGGGSSPYCMNRPSPRHRPRCERRSRRSTKQAGTIFEIQAIHGHYARLTAISRFGSLTSNSLVAASIAALASAASTLPTYLAGVERAGRFPK
jgi:hypothetical protein